MVLIHVRVPVRGSILLLCAAMAVAGVSCAKGTTPRARPPQEAAMLNLVPLPATIDATPGEPFKLLPDTAVVIEAGGDDAMRIGRFVADLMATATIPAPPVRTGSAGGKPAIRLRVAADAARGPEAYTLRVAAAGIEIAGTDAAGLFYGVQTLRQLMPVAVEYEGARPEGLAIPAVTITDTPRFAWRGAMLDVARHFFSVEDVKHYIDLIAMHKLNRLHLHLADDQGWRIEIKSWPNLTAHGGSTEVGGGPGGFYSQAQYADLVAYARDRFITIVPEIDMPGHTNAALASYAELNCDGKARQLYTGIDVGFSNFCVEKDVTYKFIDDFVREIAAMTPGPYFHIGGDEVKTLTPAQYQQFIERVQGIVQKHGKQTIGWDEIAPAALLPTTIVQHWRPKTTPREAVAKGAKIVLSPADRVYVDMKYDRATPIGLNWAAFIEVRDAYDWEPATLLDGVPETSILGIETPLWSETVANRGDLEFMAFPRLAAVAEIAWTPAARRRWDDFRVRLGAQGPRWSALGINFYRSAQVPWQPSPPLPPPASRSSKQ